MGPWLVYIVPGFFSIGIARIATNLASFSDLELVLLSLVLALVNCAPATVVTYLAVGAVQAARRWRTGFTGYRRLSFWTYPYQRNVFWLFLVFTTSLGSGLCLAYLYQTDRPIDAVSRLVTAFTGEELPPTSFHDPIQSLFLKARDGNLGILDGRGCAFRPETDCWCQARFVEWEDEFRRDGTIPPTTAYLYPRVPGEPSRPDCADRANSKSLRAFLKGPFAGSDATRVIVGRLQAWHRTGDKPQVYLSPVCFGPERGQERSSPGVLGSWVDMANVAWVEVLDSQRVDCVDQQTEGGVSDTVLERYAKPRTGPRTPYP